MKALLLSATGVAVAAAVVGIAAVAVEAPKPMSVWTKFALAGKVMKADGIGKNGETFAAIYDEIGTSSGNGPDHKWHCLGVQQGAAGAIAEQHGYCIETDPDGDQVLWKITPPPHPLGPVTVQTVHEAIAGTGKYAGISMTIKTTDQAEGTGPMAYAVKGQVTQ
jgi:hypothetical protein